MTKRERERERERDKPTTPNPNEPKKCANCGKIIVRKEENNYTTYSLADKNFCSAKCLLKAASKLPNKKNQSTPEENNNQPNEPDKKENADKEIEKEITNSQKELQNIKNQIANTDNPTKKKELEKEVNDLKNHIKNLEQERNQKNFTKPIGSPKESHGKDILIGTVIFSAVVLTLTLIIRKRRKINSKRQKQ